MNDKVYCYPPDYRVLRNRYNIRIQRDLDEIERLLVTQRLIEPTPIGNFDLAHLRAIHKHLFQDIYDWAGDVRTVEISKGGNQFQFRRFIETGMADVHDRLANADFLRGLSAGAFAKEAGRILGDLNYVHPFREGNGRSQLVYLKQLAARAGHAIDLSLIDAETWITASSEAHIGKYDTMVACIAGVIQPSGGQ